MCDGMLVMEIFSEPISMSLLPLDELGHIESMPTNTTASVQLWPHKQESIPSP